MTTVDTERLAAASTSIRHDFSRPALLAEALTHPSVQARGHGYERLEFLGDRVLGLVIADMLLAEFPAEDEGALAKRHAALVRREALARVAGNIGLGAFLSLSKGEEETGGRSNPTLLADALEAVLGALYLDGGLAAAETFIRRLWTDAMEATERPPQDAKTRLQEWAQAAARPLPGYRVVDRKGPSHNPTFTIEVNVSGYPPATGKGASKQAAEQGAAAAFLVEIDGANKARADE